MTGPGLTVAVTGPTGEIGVPFVRALERCPDVSRVVAMARRPFDPEALGWRKVAYRQGDILDRAAVDAFVAEADVVVHLAFIVVKATSRSYEINVEGSRNVFAATAAAGVPRLIYTSSVAAYGYHQEIAGPLTEEMSPRGTEAHAYSHQKAAVERVLAEELEGRDRPVAYIFRPCIVAGPDARARIDQLPYVQLQNATPAVVRGALARVPGLKPVLPDHGVAFQLVHHDDVAEALLAAVLGHGEPGIYNLAGGGEVTVTDLAHALGWRAVPIPRVSVDIAARVLAHVPPLAVEAGWLEALRTSVLMDTTRARERLGWRPRYDSHDTLVALTTATRR